MCLQSTVQKLPGCIPTPGRQRALKQLKGGFPMQAFHKILFPIDMSDTCTAAVPFVEMMAKKFDAQLTLLHVIEMPPAYFGDWYGFTAVIDMDAVRDGRINEMNSYVTGKFEALNVQRVVLEGDAAQEICNYAQ